MAEIKTPQIGIEARHTDITDDEGVCLQVAAEAQATQSGPTNTTQTDTSTPEQLSELPKPEGSTTGREGMQSAYEPEKNIHNTSAVGTINSLNNPSDAASTGKLFVLPLIERQQEQAA